LTRDSRNRLQSCEANLLPFGASTDNVVDAMKDASHRAERVTLSREFGEFLVELSIALHKYAMYPSNHPSLGPAAAGVARRAERLLEDRATIAFGVARHQLIIEGVATDHNQPVLRRLAEALHRHHVGAVSVARGVEPEEIGAVLRALSTERDGPLGLAPRERLPVWPHVRLHALSFDQLELVSDAPMEGNSGDVARSRPAELWIGLARAAMATDQAGQTVEKISAEPAVVARAIDSHQGEAAYDQVIVGYLLQIASELKSTSGPEGAALRRRIARLIKALQPETLRRLVEMGGDASQRRAFMLDATSGMAVDAVIDIVKAAAEAEGQTISHGLIRMLSKLAVHAELGQENARPLAERALREQVERLLSGWELDDPNPDAYGRVLQHLANRSSAPVPDSVQRSGEQDDLRIVKMSLEVGDSGPMVDRAIDRVIAIGAIGPLWELLASSSPPESGAVAEALLEKLRSPASMAHLVAREPLDVDTLDALLPMLPVESYEALLDALMVSENRSTRRKLLERLARTDLDIGPLIVARLEDNRWYVQRNLLTLLQRLGRIPEGYSSARWSQHPDARVRLEAVQLQLMWPAERDLATGVALQDSDPRIVRLGLIAVPQKCPPALVRLVVKVATDSAIVDDVRALAASVLGRSRDRSALDALLQLVDGGRTLRGRPKLAPPTPVCLAALRALSSEDWSKHPIAAPVLAVAADSSNADIRNAAAGAAVR
jgi:hypothetical protein